MANFKLRLEDSLFNYVQEQAAKENRSMNSFIINLIEKNQNNVIEGSLITPIKDKIELLENRLLLNRLKDMIITDGNILVIGHIKTGKTTLINKLNQMAKKCGYQTYEINQIYESAEDFNVSLETIIKENKGYYKKAIVFIDGKIIKPILQDSKYKDILFRFSEKNTDVKLCLASPMNNLILDMVTIFPKKVLTVKEKEPDFSFTYEVITLDEIINLSF